MEFSMEWNVICRVCLQEGEMRSLYEKDEEKGLTICDKIAKCSNITIKRGINLPEQICSKCLSDLEVAYRFRSNCESSDAILQSFIDGNVVTDLIVSSENGEIYKYRPPQGLNVKKIKPVPVKIEPQTEDDDPILVDNGFSDTESIAHELLAEDIKPNVAELEEHAKVKVCTIKPVKTNKVRAAKGDLKIVSAQTVTTKPDGTTVIRYRKTVKEDDKPLKICEICGNTYKYKHALESHMRRHRNEKPFSCEICNRSFVINFELRRHMRTHTGQKPYACRFCERRFSDFGSRIKHERTHTGERPYSCETCGKSFSYSHVLSSHILTHTGEKRFACEICFKRFTKSHHLKAHLNTHMKNAQKLALPIHHMKMLETGEAQITYDANGDSVYEGVMHTLSGQKMEFVEEDAIIITEDEHRDAIASINMNG